MVVHTFNTSARGQRQVDLYELQISQSYMRLSEKNTEELCQVKGD